MKYLKCSEWGGCLFHDHRLTESKLYDDRVNICWIEQKRLIFISFQDVFYVSCWLGIHYFPGKMKVILSTLYKSSLIIYSLGDQLSCIIELLGMPPQKLLDQSKRAKNFISCEDVLRMYMNFFESKKVKIHKMLTFF